MNDLTEYLSQRNEALRTLDIGWARKQHAAPPSDDVILIALHKARYSCTAIEAELRHASANWLREHGYGGMSGEPLLPIDELPR